MMKPLIRPIFRGLGLVLALQASAAQSANLLNAGLSYGYNDNLSNGERPSDVKGDQYLDLDLSAGRFIQLNRDLGLIVKATAGVTAFETYSGLNNRQLGASATLRHKFGLGPMAPVANVSLDASYLDSNHDPRDRWIYKGGLGVTKRVTERVELGLNYERLETDPDERAEPIAFLVNNFGIGSNVWDLRRRSLTASLIVAVSERLSAYGSYSWQDGTIVSSTKPDINRLSVYDEAALDPVFGPGVVAYTIDADTDIATLGLSWALNDHSSLNLSYERRDSEGGSGFKYDNNLYQASLLYAF